MRALWHRLAWLSCLVFAAVAQAQVPVPAQLEPWRGWVLQGQEFRACPLITGKQGTVAEDFLCAWPGVLTLAADADGASVAQHWRVDADSWIPLPGDEMHWPQQVSVDGKPAVVVDHGGPALRLAAGAYDIRARIPWSERPQSLRVPANTGIVALSVDGKPVAPVQRDGDELTLGRAESSAPEADSIDLHVYRRLKDGVPAILTTQIRMYVSGQAREEIIGPALPEGFAPLELTGEWPARLDADGKLRIRVQPGADTLTLVARAIAPLSSVTVHPPAAPWPTQEIWSYAAAPRLRITTASSALQVDPRQAQVPEEWYDLPAFALADGSVLKIDERSRGLATDDRNRLTLDREMWLDFDGGGWFARDRVRGQMLQGWRFDAAAPFALERADAIGIDHGGNPNEALLVTQGAAPELTGVEWRTPAVDLAAGLRIVPASASLPVTGWQDTFDGVSTTLHLPDGYRLLGAPGSDSASGSWISRWTLLDVFVAAIVVLLAWRGFGLVGALVAAGYLVLGYQEFGAPLWTLLAALAFALIARALPRGKLATGAEWTRRAAVLLLMLAALPFVAAQLRFALHPQLESEGSYESGTLAGGLGLARKAAVPQYEADMNQVADAASAPPASPPPPPAPAAAMEREEKQKDNDKLETITVTGSNIRRLDVIEHYSQATIVQTGAGEPGWQRGQRYQLAWSGPVPPEQNVRLIIAPPWLVRPLRVVLVALLAWLLVRLIRSSIPVASARSAATVIGAIALGSLIAVGPARAQSFPPDNLLNELRTHLTEAPKCAPACASIANVEAIARGDEIRVVLQAHAAERIALPMPSAEKTLIVHSVLVDGVAQDGLARQGDTLWLALPRGVHRIELVFTAVADKVSLAFPLAPMRVAFSGEGWEASGIAEDRLMTETLTLVRARAEGAEPATSGAQQFAPFVRIVRSLTLDLDWNVDTQATRLAPQDGGFTVQVPILKNERVLSSGFKVENGHVTAGIGDGEMSTSWSSTLDKSDTLTLTAPPLGDRAEVWRVVVSPTWHVEFSGVPVSAAPVDSDPRDFRNFEFYPLPGETLTLRVTRPQPVAGSTRAIDTVRLTHAIGQRAANSTLTLTVRASQGGEQVITLPVDSEVLGVTRNGEVLNLRPESGKLPLPIVPGTQTFEVRLRDNAPAAFLARTPAIELGLPAANIGIGLDLPADRWLLATTGPAAGPAVLYWSELAVMLLIAWALVRTRRTPLKLWQWILLGIGFSTFSWVALLVVVAWLFALDWRARFASPANALAFNAAQIGLAALTVVALLCLVAAIPQGLLGTPDMHVAGNGSSAQSLQWFVDRSADALPRAGAISVPMWVYKLAMLAWALWLANAVVGWLRYGFAAWTRDGYWRRVPRAVVEVPAATPPPTPRQP
jgi:hypothetical protein